MFTTVSIVFFTFCLQILLNYSLVFQFHRYPVWITLWLFSELFAFSVTFCHLSPIVTYLSTYEIITGNASCERALTEDFFCEFLCHFNKFYAIEIWIDLSFPIPFSEFGFRVKSYDSISFSHFQFILPAFNACYLPVFKFILTFN